MTQGLLVHLVALFEAEVLQLMEENWMDAGREEEEAGLQEGVAVPAEGLLKAASSALEEHQRKGSFGRKTMIRRRFQQISRDLKEFKCIS